MTILKAPPKQPYAIKPYQVDLRPMLLRGQRVAGMAARVYLKGNDPETQQIDAMLYAHAFGDQLLQVKIMAGETGQTYRCRCRFTCVDGSRDEVEFEFNVKEVV